MEAYLLENEDILSLESEDFEEVSIVDSEVHISDGGETPDGRIDILAKYGQDYVAVVELKMGMLTQNHLTQLEGYLSRREEILKNSINTIESGDMEGIQTYCYQIPEKDLKTCGHLVNIYVTREQLRNFPNLIPPLHLGCKVTIAPKAAWNTNLDGTGWKPFLPVNGKYPTPDWRTIVEI